jgi:hypothetical protein
LGRLAVIHPRFVSQAGADGCFLLGRGKSDGATGFGNYAGVGVTGTTAGGGARDVEFIHPAAKCIWMKIQDPRRALWTINHSTGVLKGGEDMVSFYFVEREEWLWR